MNQRIHVITMGGGDDGNRLVEDVRSALRTLRYFQERFEFIICPDQLPACAEAGGAPVKWADLERVLVQKKAELKADYLICILDQPIERNWFSRAIPGANVAFITTWSWEYLSDIGVRDFVAYEIAQNLVELLAQREEPDKDWYLKNLVHTGPLTGCLNDFCAVKPQLALKIRSAYICSPCKKVLRTRLSDGEMSAVVDILEATRERTAGNWPSEPLLWDQVQKSYPFPIAYCLRAMQTEVTYTRKWLCLYDLYKLIIKYLVFVLLADRTQHAPATGNGLPPADLKRLAFASDGTWGKVAFELLAELPNRGPASFFAGVAASYDKALLAAGSAASRALVATRNNKAQGHGHIPSEPGFQVFCERHFGDLKTLLNLIKPLANYTLAKPDGQVSQAPENRWEWEGKVMMGSNPVFHRDVFVTAEFPGNHCRLINPDTHASLSLHPWLLLDYCHSCQREMVFLYDQIQHQSVVHREYPTNHEWRRPGLTSEIQGQIGVPTA